MHNDAELIKASLSDFFRQEHGHLMATLCQKVGLKHLQDVEDAVQSAMLKAMEKWQSTATPQHLSAWLFRVASNHLLGKLRQNHNRTLLLEQYCNDIMRNDDDQQQVDLNLGFQDQTLNWLFICSAPKLSTQLSVVFALKSLCGYTINGIARRLFITQDTAYKRYNRAKKYLIDNAPQVDELTATKLIGRTHQVHLLLYLMFTEGHLSEEATLAIRQELCHEAIRLTTLLATHKIFGQPQTCALLSLMHFHTARLVTRHDDVNNLLLLAEQDRTQWDNQHIHLGFHWLQKSATGSEFSSYHAQASIAAEHCLSPSMQETRWDKIINDYELLNQIAPNPIHQLNQIVAIAEWHGPHQALKNLKKMTVPRNFKESYQWHAVCADLYSRSQQHETATIHRDQALTKAPSQAIKNSLIKRFNSHNS